MNPSKTIRRQPDLVQQALFYKGFVELFGWQHSGNGRQQFRFAVFNGKDSH